MKLRVIDALQLPEVLDGSRWFALPVPVIGTERQTTDHDLLTMTVGVDPVRHEMFYCDGFYDKRSIHPTHFGTKAALTLKTLLGECKLVDAPQTYTELLALYCRVMREIEDVFVKHESYIVRQWDGMDGCWTDCTKDVPRDEALRVWADYTDGGTRRVQAAELSYYRIFPGGTRMLWDGSEGREMHR